MFDDELEHDRDMRRRQLEALARAGLTPDVIADNYMDLLSLNKSEGNSREQRMLLKDLARLMGSDPRSRTSIDVRSDSRVLSLTLGEGAVAQLSPDQLRRLSPEKRRAYLALLAEAKEEAGEGEPARVRLQESSEDPP